MDDVPKERPLAIDATAQSASPTEPAFIARPKGAPVYYGFVVLDDGTVDGFTLGKITDFEAEPCDEGEAFVIAPDGNRADTLPVVPLARDASAVTTYPSAVSLPLTNRMSNTNG